MVTEEILAELQSTTIRVGEKEWPRRGASLTLPKFLNKLFTKKVIENESPIPPATVEVTISKPMILGPAYAEIKDQALIFTGALVDGKLYRRKEWIIDVNAQYTTLTVSLNAYPW